MFLQAICHVLSYTPRPALGSEEYGHFILARSFRRTFYLAPRFHFFPASRVCPRFQPGICRLQASLREVVVRGWRTVQQVGSRVPTRREKFLSSMVCFSCLLYSTRCGDPRGKGRIFLIARVCVTSRVSVLRSHALHLFQQKLAITVRILNYVESQVEYERSCPQ